MKKIVNGRVYDTGEATAVVSWTENECVSGIPVTVRCSLNRKRVVKDDPGDALSKLKLASWGGVIAYDVEVDCSKGEFFVAKEIGHASVGRVWPVSDTEAKRIFEEHAEADYSVEDSYERWFGVRPGVDDQLSVLKRAFEAGRNAQIVRQAEEARKKAEGGDKPL